MKIWFGCISITLLVLVLMLNRQFIQLQSDFVKVNHIVQHQIEAVASVVTSLVDQYANEPTSQAVVELLEKCTFTVLSPYEPGLFGSAVLINKEKGILFTAGHVAEDMPRELRYDGVVVPILVCRWTNDVDVGLLQVDPNLICDLDCIAVPFAQRDPASGIEVFSSGYPTVAIGDQVVFSGLLLSAIQEVQYGRFRLIDMPFLPGMSGGPVVNISGELVGIGTISYQARTFYGGRVSVGISGMTTIGDIKSSFQELLVGDPNESC